MAYQIQDFRKTDTITLLDGLSGTSGTSAAYVNNSTATDVAGYSRLGLRLTGTAIDGGSATFTVQMSDNASDWVGYNMLIDNVTDSTATAQRVASKNIASNSHIMVWFTPDTYSKFVRAVCYLTGTITATAVLMANTA